MIDGILRDGARDYFKAKGLTYKDVTEGDILALVLLLNRQIKADIKSEVVSIPTMRLSKKISIKYNTNGTIISCYLYVNSDYFKLRECISFNEDGFIGFAGWASDNNVSPFTKAFCRWCDELANE